MKLDTHKRRGERGFLMIALIVIVSIMLLYVAASIRVLDSLNREINGIERVQIKRIEKKTVTSNLPANTTTVTNSPAQ